MENAWLRTVRLGKQAAMENEMHAAKSMPIVHDWRPPIEDERLVSRVSKAAGIPEAQILIVPPAKFVYDDKTEVPIRLQRYPPKFNLATCMDDWLAGHRLMKDVDSYSPYRLMQDVYDNVKREMDDDDLPVSFAHCKTGPAMIKTFEKLGNLNHILNGTCCFRKGRGKQWFVLVDAFMERKDLIMGIVAQLNGGRGNSTVTIQLPKPTTIDVSGSTLFSIPLAAFQAGRYNIVKKTSFITTDKSYDFGGPEKRALFQDWDDLGREGDLEVSPKFGPVKVSVEIDRRVLGLGSVVLFETPELAHCLDRVWERVKCLDKSVIGCLDGLKIVQVAFLHPSHYVMVPEFVDPNMDLPYDWALRS